MAIDYHTAYGGIATTADGSFDHFVRYLDSSHLQSGHWRFQSVDDDRRAMASGFTTPEALLMAAEESDTSSDQSNQIVLRWVRGANDPHPMMALSGSASQHLCTIYELRALLGLPMSSRGRVPLYPVSTDVRMRQYWERKYSAQISVQVANLTRPVERPSPSPITPQPWPVSLSHANRSVSAAPEDTQTYTRAQVVEKAQTTQPLSAADEAHAQQRPSTTTAPTDNGTRVIQHNWIHTASRTPSSTALFHGEWNHELAPRQQQGRSRGLVQPLSVHFSPNAQFNGNIASRSLCSTNKKHEIRARASIGTTKQGAGQIPSGVGTENISSQGITESAFPQENPSTVRSDNYDTSQYTTSEANPAPAEGAPLGSSPLNAPLSRSTTSLSSCALAILPLAAHSSPLKLSNTPAPTSTVPSPQRISTPIVPRAEEGSPKSVKKSMPTDSNPKIASVSQCDTLKHLSELPCIDCGEEGGHRDDCHVGNLGAMTNLTVLDYRTLTDAVKRFDPGPFTTHFDQYPDAKPEDPMSQIAGIAAVIRNEDSYRQDIELHNLPDDVMILLWAFKRSDGVCVINEDEWI